MLEAWLSSFYLPSSVSSFYYLTSSFRPLANIKSAKKALRQTKRRAERNKALKVKLKKEIKELLKKGDAGVELKNLSQVESTIDKAAKRRIIHKNRAAKMKSRLRKSVKLAKPSKQKSKTTTKK